MYGLPTYRPIGTENLQLVSITTMASRNGALWLVRSASGLVVLLACSTLLAQTTAQVNRPQTVHIRGTVRASDDGSPISGVDVTFIGGNIRKSVYTDRRGMYEANLPVGLYKMGVNPSDWSQREYERPLFRVTAPTKITFDFLVGYEHNCDVGAPMGSNQMPNLEDATDACGGSVSFPVPSKDGASFEVLIQFGQRARTPNGDVYSAEWDLTSPPPLVYRSGMAIPNLGTQVFVAYNLFTLYADHVTFDAQRKVLRAKGRVVIVNPDGGKSQSDSIAFKLKDGEAVRLPAATW